MSSRLSLGSIAALSTPAFPMFALMMPLVIFIPPFFAEHMGLGMAAVGAIFTLGRLFDVVTDPVAGILMDRTQERMPKRVWVVIGAIPLALGTWQIFFAEPPGSSSLLMFWIVVLYAGWTLMSVGLFSWAGEVSGDYHDRSRVMGAIQMANNAGTVGVLLVPALIEIVGVDGDIALLRVRAMGTFIIVMLPIALGIAWLFAPPALATSHKASPMLPVLLQAIRNRSLRLLLGADLAVGLNIGVFTSLTVFLIEIVLGLEGRAGILQLALLASGLAGVPVFVFLANKIEKHRALALTSLFSGFGGMAVLFLPPNNFVLVLIVYAMFGFASGAAQLLPRAIMADVLDESRALSGDQNTGLYFSFLTTTLKLGLAFGVGLTFGLADLAGFDPTTARVDDSADWIIRSLMGILPMILGLIIMLLMWNFPLGRSNQEALRAQIAHRSGH